MRPILQQLVHFLSLLFACGNRFVRDANSFARNMRRGKVYGLYYASKMIVYTNNCFFYYEFPGDYENAQGAALTRCVVQKRDE